MKLPTASYVEQSLHWPSEGPHVMAHYDDETVVVYQAYRPAIGEFAIKHGRLDGPHFSLERMSWIKPNFMWMMYRSGWGTKEGQEITLGLRLRRSFFDGLMAAAVPSSYDPAGFASSEEWKVAVANSDVRLQWDPDHSPSGAKLARRAIQLGLRGAKLRAFANAELLEVIDLSSFVQAQRINAQDRNPDLLSPVEKAYRSSIEHQDDRELELPLRI